MLSFHVKFMQTDSRTEQMDRGKTRSICHQSFDAEA